MTLMSHPFPGVPLIESPVFDLMLELMELTQAEQDIAVRLNRDGYAVIDFPDPEIDMRVERIRARLASEFEMGDADPPSVKAGGKGRVQDAWQYDDDVQVIAANPTILSLLSRLYGRRAFPFQTLNFPVGTRQHPHADAAHFSSLPERFMCGVWLAMEDISANAGPLCYVPGSHKWPIVNNVLIGRRGWGQALISAQTPYHDAWDALMAVHESSLEHFLARKGQALIWCANLLHGGSLRTDPTRTRWSQAHYFFDDCVYYTPAFSDEALGRLALREIGSMADGAPKANLYLGEQILSPPVHEKQTPTRFWKQVKNRVRNFYHGREE
jgi:hypothetical protein